MYCPECGNDAESAKFCPECGANLAGVKDALSGKPGARSGGAKAAQAGGSGKGSAAASPEAPKRLSPAVIWGGFGALAVVVIIVVVMVSGGFGGDAGGGGAGETSGAPVEAVEADTSGSYAELVARGNELYDKGDAEFQNQNFEQGGAYFAAAAEVYAAAWKKQSSDSGVGTDFAVALFYSGDIDGALKQVEVVLKADPEFQKGWLNKGIFLSHEARLLEQSGDKQEARKLTDEARNALTQAVAIDAKSEAGKQADSMIQAMSQ